MSPTSITPNTIEDNELIEDLVNYMEDFTNKEIYYFQKWNFKTNPFDQRPFFGDQSSVKSRRNFTFKKILKELLISFNSYDHILFKAPSGAGKTFLLQELFAILNTPRINVSLAKGLREKESCKIAMIDGFVLRDIDKNERINYLIENGVCNEESSPIADIIIIDNFAPIHNFWHQVYSKYFSQSFLIASIQTSEYYYLEALKNQEIGLPFKEQIQDENKIQLRTNDPLEIFTKQLDVPEWNHEELIELLRIRIQEASPDNGLEKFEPNFLELLAKNSLGLPGLCLDLALDVLKKAIALNLDELKAENQYLEFINSKFFKAANLLKAFQLKDQPKYLKQFDDSTISIVNQLSKKTRKDLMKRLLVSMGGYHIQTKQKWTVGTELEDYFNSNDNLKANDFATSLSPTKLATVLDKTQSTLSYHLSWFQNEEMIDIITPNSISAFKKNQSSFDKIILPPSPFAQLFEIILQIGN
jgi:hypothetical protein